VIKSKSFYNNLQEGVKKRGGKYSENIEFVEKKRKKKQQTRVADTFFPSFTFTFLFLF